MASVLKVDKLDPQSGTALEIGTSGDTITVPTGAGLTVTDEVKTNKISPATGVAFALGDSGDTFTVPSGATIVNSGTATGFGITAANFRPNAKPLIINGDMAVAQRSTSEAGLTSFGYKTVDRFTGDCTTLGTWTHSQDTNAPAGFAKSLKLDCTTADASPAAGDLLYIDYAIEAQDLQFLKFGTADAETITVAFWVKSYQTGDLQLTLYDWDNNKLISASYEIDSSATWEKKILTFAGNTSDNFADDNGAGLSIWFPLDTGSTWESGDLRSSWTTYAQGDFNPAGAVNVGDNSNNYWQITGLQVEAGTYTSSTIPPFQHESYGDNLQRCQRYCYNTNQNNTLYAALSVGAATSTGGVYGELYFPVTMRDNPTGTVVQSTDYWALNSSGGGTDTFDNILVQNCSTTQGTIYCTGNVSQTAGQASRIRNNNTAARLLVVSEL
jgi:hypothetical protein